MRLKSLRLRNFKGAKDFLFEPGGLPTAVYGDNGTRKTTLADALAWLLTGKDSAGNAPGTASFNIKPLDLNNCMIPDLQNEAEAELLTDDGSTLTIGKVHCEIWEKKRNGAGKEFSGHRVKHFVNGVPVKEREYQEQILQICTEEQARLLTDPDYLPGKLHWTKRRAFLLEMCGDVSDEDVVDADPTLAPLLDMLTAQKPIAGKTKAESLRAVTDARRRAINDRQKEIPTRIDEATRALPTALFDAEGDQRHAEAVRENVQALESGLARLDSGGQAAQLEKELAGAETEETRARAAVDAATRKKQAAEDERARTANRAADDAREKARAAQRAANNALAQAQDAQAAAERKRPELMADLDRLRAEWLREDESEFPGAGKCLTCGQDLPADQVKAARADWNERRAQALAANVANGIAKKGELDGLDLKIAELQAAVNERQQEDEDAQRAATEAEAVARVTAPIAAADYAADEACCAAAAKVADLKRRLAELATGSTAPEAARIRADLEAARTDLKATDSRLALAAEREKGQKRIDELEAEQKLLAAEWDELERVLHLMDQFTRAKAALLTDRINARFGIVRWKLFNELVNGSLEDCCEALIFGVPYSGANTGGRINAGLDCVRTIGQHLGFTMPVFCDNCESITRPIIIPAQVIRLVVSEPDKILRIEVDSAQAKLEIAA